MILVGAGDGRFAGEMIAGVVTGRRDQDRGGAIHAKIVAGGEVDKTFGIDPAEEVVMQIATFRHFTQECEQKRRLAADGIVVAGGSLFRGRLLCQSNGNGKDHQCENQSRHSPHEILLLERHFTRWS